MAYVELNRAFQPIPKDQETSVDASRYWGRALGSWMEWPELREYRRVVLLAEASSGKSEEFRNQTVALGKLSKAAFFLRIEELADQGFFAALDAHAARSFEQWRNGTEDAWFFLDSVDEARLNQKHLETALKRFARELDQSLERSHIFISCRVSDWKGRDDRAIIERLLPSWEKAAEPPAAEAAANPLLDPVFKEKSKTETIQQKKEKKVHELLVVQLHPLTNEQCELLAGAEGVLKPGEFMNGVRKNGLDAFIERPGDVLDLASYWNSYGKFGSLSEMVEHAVEHKLEEREKDRPDNSVLSVERARKGAERIAAALTLGKSFTLRAPNYGDDPSLASGAIDPALVLPEWTDAERNALVRRGIFAPSTYGRIRLHHRSTQEYLTASWFAGLLAANCPRAAIWNLLFPDRYGVATVTPSLRPAAAWLALRDRELCEEIVEREPVILLRQGDPTSLAIDIKSRTLLFFARKHAAGEIADRSIDHRSLTLFAEPGLANATREAWNANSREEFRLELLYLIKEGKIVDCLDIVRAAAFDVSGSDYHRSAAVQAMQACDDNEGLAAVAAELVSTRAGIRERLASPMAEILYPRYLNTNQLLALVRDSEHATNRSSNGFMYSLPHLYDVAPNRSEQTELVEEIADLCLSPPFLGDYERISARFHELATALEKIARREIARLAGQDPPDFLTRTLMVLERAKRHGSFDADRAPISALVRGAPKLNRALLWRDVEDQRKYATAGREITRPWQVYFGGQMLWGLGQSDLAWLGEDLVGRDSIDDRRVALSAILSILKELGLLDTELARLRGAVADSPVLLADLNGFLSPPTPSPELIEHEREMAKFARQRESQEKDARAWWQRFERDVRADPKQLSDPNRIGSWKTGGYKLKTLTDWLFHRTGEHGENAPREWRLLEEGFGREVAEAYRDGMRTVWRLTKPERPKHTAPNNITTKWTTIQAFHGIGIEAAENADWASQLTEAEIGRAAEHGCYSEQGFPEWIHTLVETSPDVVLPVIKRHLAFEWRSEIIIRRDFLQRYADSRFPIPEAVKPILLSAVSGKEPNQLDMVRLGLRIVRRLQLDHHQKRQLCSLAKRRLTLHIASSDSKRALQYLALLLVVDIDNNLDSLERCLQGNGQEATPAHAIEALGALFERHSPLLGDALQTASIATLERLLEFAYYYVRPEHDVVHEGPYTPGVRDEAEGARNAVLSQLIERPGPDAFYALKNAIEKPAFKDRTIRFNEIAHGKAESDAESPAWSESDVRNFELQHTAPVKTGADLLRVVLAVFADIQLRMRNDDASSRALLEKAQTEEEVQGWVVEQLNHRSKDRYHAYREVHVADEKRPDVVVASTAAKCELAVEVKQAMSWTPRQLESALRNQLAEDYLKPSSRRHGVLLITNHRQRKWRKISTGELMDFADLCNWLDEIAQAITNNELGHIGLRCIGIDALAPPKRLAS